MDTDFPHERHDIDLLFLCLTMCDKREAAEDTGREERGFRRRSQVRQSMNKQNTGFLCLYSSPLFTPDPL